MQLSTPTREELKKVCFRLTVRQIDSVATVAQMKGVNWTSTVRNLLDYSLSTQSVNDLIKSKRDELKKITDEIESKKGAFNFFERLGTGNRENSELCCQRCGQVKSRRKMFKIRIGIEELKFCEDCYFSGDYKQLVRQII